jgi:hypothetical protein
MQKQWSQNTRLVLQTTVKWTVWPPAGVHTLTGEIT